LPYQAFMLWFLLALNTALFTACGDALSKHYLRHLGTPSMVMARILGPSVIFLPVLLFWPWPELSQSFWKTIAILYPLETIAILCYMEAIRISPLSLTVPYLAFTPAFIILTGYVILGEKLSTAGTFGIFLIVCGSYFLNLSLARYGFWHPLKAIFKERGSVLMLLVAFIYAFTSVLLKVAIKHSERFFFAIFYYGFLGIFVALALTLFCRQTPWTVFKNAPKGASLVSISQAVAAVCHVWAISLAPAAYMIAVKRLSVLFGVVIGGIFFGEKAFGERLFGAILMLAGVFLIALSG